MPQKIAGFYTFTCCPSTDTNYPKAAKATSPESTLIN
jgi:hypothetical protein